MLPNFFIVGATKSGTTSLWRYCSEHPEIFMSNIKEPNFFSNNQKRMDLNGYKKLFEGVHDEKAVGEASTSYLWFDGTPRKINELIGECKIIIMLRNPVDRLYSEFQHHLRQGRFVGSFDKMLFNFYNNKDDKKIFSPAMIVSTGYYSNHIKSYLDAFGKEKIFIGLFDDLVKNPIKVMRSLFRFLEVDHTFLPQIEKIYNTGGEPYLSFIPPIIRFIGIHSKSVLLNFFKYDTLVGIRNRILRTNSRRRITPLTSDQRRKVLNIYKSDILKLQILIDRDFRFWLEG